MMDWKLAGAGDDPVAFYSEVEPRVREIAERVAGQPLDYKEVVGMFNPLLGLARWESDWTAWAKNQEAPAGSDPGQNLIRLAPARFKRGDIQQRLYHQAAPDTLALALGFEYKAPRQ